MRSCIKKLGSELGKEWFWKSFWKSQLPQQSRVKLKHKYILYGCEGKNAEYIFIIMFLYCLVFHQLTCSLFL